MTGFLFFSFISSISDVMVGVWVTVVGSRGKGMLDGKGRSNSKRWQKRMPPSFLPFVLHLSSIFLIERIKMQIGDW